MYGRVAKALHWLVVVALAAQFAVGYLLDVGGQGRGRGRGRGSGPGRGRGRGGEDLLAAIGEDAVLTVHVVLGATILVLAVVRLLWRRRVGLPPWAPTLSAVERRVEHRVEQVLYVVLFAIPLTGFAVVATDGDAIGLHIGTHVVFFVAFAVHVGLVLKHQLLHRDQLLRRML